MRGVARLVDRQPTVSPERLIAQLTPPPTFAQASFASYHPDPAEPTQSAAVAACQRFCERAVEHRRGRRRLLGRRKATPVSGCIWTVVSASARRICWPPPIVSCPTIQPTPKLLRHSWNSLSSPGCSVLSNALICWPITAAVYRLSSSWDDPGNTTLIRGCFPNSSRTVCQWPPPPTPCQSTSVRGGSPPTTSCAKSARWQQYSM